VLAVAAEPKIALAAAAANAASPAAVAGMEAFDGPKWEANAVPPFSLLYKCKC